MASLEKAWLRLDGHREVRDAVLPDLAAQLGLEAPVVIPGARHTGALADANQAAINTVLLQAVQQLVARVAELEQLVKAKGR